MDREGKHRGVPRGSIPAILSRRRQEAACHTRTPRSMARRSARRRTLVRRRRLVALAIVGACLIVFLYYRPVQAYLDTRDALAKRRAEVRALAEQKQRLEERLALNEGGATLLRAARRINLVKPGERLVIVAGIAAWRRAHSASLGR
jgi:cell division protein FtsB